MLRQKVYKYFCKELQTPTHSEHKERWRILLLPPRSERDSPACTYFIVLLALGKVPLQDSEEQIQREERPPQDEDDEKDVPEDRKTTILDLDMAQQTSRRLPSRS